MNSETPLPPTQSAPTPKPKRTKRQKFWLFTKWMFGTGFVLGIFALIFVGIFVIRSTRDLPTLEAVKAYSPAVMSRVQAGDGKLIAEYGVEKRVFVPIESIPKQIQYALVASEDQRYYTHDGFDPKGFARAMLANVKSKVSGIFTGRRTRLEGGSTLTQQVAKHFLVGSERNVERKVREVFIAKRIEKALSKDEILELYLNDVYFGRRAYGIAGASLNYFNKPLDELTLGQMAYLSGLVKGPNNYQPDDNMEKAINRRNYVLGRMFEDGYITEDELNAAKAEELYIVDRLFGDEYLAAEYFVAEVRKQINDLYGEDQLNEGGLSIRTTLDTKMQLEARKQLRRGIEMFDRRHGYRGPLGTMETEGDWQTALADYQRPPDIEDWRLALVLEAEGKTAKLGFAKRAEDPAEGADLIESETGTLSVADIEWAAPIIGDQRLGKAPTKITDAVNVGDMILVQKKPGKADETGYNLRQIPEVNGSIMAMDPHTGRILALVGGYSFQQSQFNRATQAYRQPGSAFKPFVYAAALDNGFTPATQVLDAPFVIEHNDRDEQCKELQGEGLVATRFGQADEDGQDVDEIEAEAQRLAAEEAEAALLRGEEPEEEKECGPVFYKPANFNAGKFYGLSTLRLGLEKSRNAMTVRLANDIGMTVINEYARRFGIYEETKPELAWSLGAGETTLLRISAAYAALVNGGKKVTPTLLDRVQDNKGKTIYIHDDRVCPECRVEEWNFSSPPSLPDDREQVLSPVTAYQVTSMLEGVVQRGTGRTILRLDRPMAGKTGTTNDFKDAWFMGFSPDLVAGVYIGYDTPRPLWNEAGAIAAAPIFRDFMGAVLKDKPKVSFRIPEGVLLAPVDQVTGEPSYIGAPGFIYEAFKPGTEPRIGSSRSKINVGGGESFGGFDFDFSGSGLEAEQSVRDEDSDAKNEMNLPDAVKVPLPGGIQAERQEGVGENGEQTPVNGQSPAPAGSKAPLVPKPVLPRPDAPKQEDPVDLDDGLY